MTDALRDRLHRAAASPRRSIDAAAIDREARKRVRRRRTAVLSAVVLGAGVALGVFLSAGPGQDMPATITATPAPPSASAVPSLSITPATGLKDGQHVAVNISGYPAGSRLQLRMCATESAGAAVKCSSGAYAYDFVKSKDTAIVEYAVHQWTFSPGQVDPTPCGDDCILQVSPVDDAKLGTSSVPLHFGATTGPPESPSQPNVSVTWEGKPRDGVQVTVMGSRFKPDTDIQVLPCIPNTDCGGYTPIGTARTDKDGFFRTTVVLHRVVRVAIGGTAFCAHDCSLVGVELPMPASIVAKSAPFDLAAFPSTASACSGFGLSAAYAGRPAGTNDAASAAVRLTNTGSQPCWLFGAPTVQLLSHGQVLPNLRAEVNKAGTPRLVILQPGDSAGFTEVKATCSAPAADTLGFTLPGDNVWLRVRLPEQPTGTCAGSVNLATVGYFSIVGG